jgi:hypothetical protein
MGTTVATELVHHGERRDRAGRQHVPRERREQLLTRFGDRVDAAGIRAARGHPVYDVLQLDAGGGEASG